MNARLVAIFLTLAVAAGCGGSGVQFTLRDPSGKVTRAPANGARLEAARRELFDLVGRQVDVQIETSLLPSDLAGFTEHYARTVETLVSALRGLRRDQPDAFTQVGSKLTAVDLRYDATIDHAMAKLDGTTLRVRSPASLQYLGMEIVAALAESYQGDDGAKLFAMDPRQVPPARHAAYFDAITHYSRYEKRQPANGEGAAPLPSWDPSGEVIRSDGRGRSLQKVLGLYPLLPVGELREEAAKHILSEGEYYLLSMWHERSRAQSTQAPNDSVVRQTQRAYAAFLKNELGTLSEKNQVRAARQVFSRDEVAARGAFAGFDRLGWALTLAQHAATRAEPARSGSLEDEVVCPYREGDDGKLVRNASCNAGYHRSALGDDDSRRRLARFLADADPRAARDAFANLRWVREPAVLDLFHDIEASPRARNAAGRVLGDAFAREGEWREQVRKEGYALYGRRTDARGIALYIILATEPHRGLEAVQAGLSPAPGPAEIRDLLAVGPRALGFLAEGWHTLQFPKASLVAPHLGSTTKTETLLELAKAACKEGKRSELQSLRSSMENAARASQLDRSRYDGALESMRPEACPPPTR